MIIQSCPRCGSSRIRRGYRPTPWWQAIFGRYNLLCNSCNWEFVGLAIPGTVPEQQSRGRKRQPVESEQIQPKVIVRKADSFAETQGLSKTVGSNNSKSGVSDEFIDDLETNSQPVLLVKESQSDANIKILEDIQATETAAQNRPDINETTKHSATDDVSNQSNTDVIISGKAKHQRTKRKKRAR